MLRSQLKSMARSEEEEFIFILFSRADQLCSVIFIMYMTLQNGSDRLCELFQILLSHFLAIRQTFQDRMESLSRDAGMGSRDGIDGYCIWIAPRRFFNT